MRSIPVELRHAQVGPFSIADETRDGVVAAAVELAVEARGRVVAVFALHVGGLNERGNRDFVRAMNSADLTYADGGSVVLLARVAGGQRIERAPTTDIGWDIIAGLAKQLGRPARLALVGGPSGLADRAGALLAAPGNATVVITVDGYQQDWASAVAQVRAADPDLVVVGLGAPREMLWVEQWRPELPASLVLTCGGWFGHIVGDERRAPRLLRHSGVEWIARFAQAPRRLGPRYARGLWSSALLLPAALRQRFGKRR